MSIIEDKITILYVDDEVYNLNSFKAYFRTEKQYRVYTCTSGKEGLDILEHNDIDIVIADQKMPDMSGIEFLEEADNKNSIQIKIVVTAHRNINAVIQAFNKGLIFEYHEKPWHWDDIKSSIEKALKIIRK
ncbi:MAG: response regulator [Cytophagaceae bacterium]|nr:response regulator [Cytophagaceae bacterium]